MASILSAVLSKYDALDATQFPGGVRPPIYLELAPDVVDGLQIRPPYIVVNIGPGEELLTFESDEIETSQLTMIPYDISVGSIDTTLNAIRFNGRPASENAGFDNGTLPDLTGGTLLSMLLTRTPGGRSYSGMSRTGERVHMGRIEYTIQVQLS